MRSTSMPDALLLRFPDALLAGLDGVGSRHVYVDVADRVGFATGRDLGLRGAGKERQHNAEDRGKLAG